uniref:Uncharacterized protein n=1 Tax=Arundo donax TaxID=35708 RepID=A0A0A9U482_ARUDO
MPLLHLAHLLLCRGRHRRRHATPSALHSRESTAGAAVVELTLPSGGSNGPQSTEEVPFRSNFLNVVTTSTATLRPAFAEALARLEPQLDLLVHDGFLVSAKDTAADLDVSQLVSVGTSGFASYVCATVMRQKPHVHVSRWAAGGRRVSELAWRKQASVVVIVSGGGRGRGGRPPLHHRIRRRWWDGGAPRWLPGFGGWRTTRR